MMRNLKVWISIGAFINLSILPGCEVDVILEDSHNESENNIHIKQFGSENSFEIATWNIEHFPKNQDFTIPYINRIIRDINIDLIAVQEIDDTKLFMELIDSLVGYHGFVSQYPNYGQRLGIIYKSDIISISSPTQIFVDDKWAFPRPPLVTYVVVKKSFETVFDFILIILHLKAFTDEESQDRRREACQKLEEYISTYLLTGAEKDILIVGDFNDEIDDSMEENIFQFFLNDSSNYNCLTLLTSDTPTFIGNSKSSLDHIIITDDVRIEYKEGDLQVLEIDKFISNYVEYVSDHRPVLARFYIF